MDKYEFNIKAEQMRKMAEQGCRSPIRSTGVAFEMQIFFPTSRISMSITVNMKKQRTSFCWRLSVPRSANAFCTSWLKYPSRQAISRMRRNFITSSVR